MGNELLQTLRTKQGICYDFSHLFAAFCRSQNIACDVVDGSPYDRTQENHTWNRVYFNDSWWDMDLSNDTIAVKENRTPYSFRELESIAFPDKDFFITKIY